jgi:hypothetical protein
MIAVLSEAQEREPLYPVKAQNRFWESSGELNEVDESRIETILTQKDLPKLLRALKKAIHMKHRLMMFIRCLRLNSWDWDE